LRLHAALFALLAPLACAGSGGSHLMPSMLSRPLLPGEQVPLQLLLEGGGSVAVTARVRPLGEH